MTEFVTHLERLIHAVRSYSSIRMVIMGSPDPDAIAACGAFSLICGILDVPVSIEALQPPSLPQNRKLISFLKLPVSFVSTHSMPAAREAYGVFDFQSCSVEGLTGKIPCAVHIDHHTPKDDYLPADFRLIRADAGSASTLMALLLKQMNNRFAISRLQLTRTCTALYFGMQTDTDDFSQLSGLDREALDFLVPHTDFNFLNLLDRLPFPPEYLGLLHRAIRNRTVYNDWLISGIGFIPDSRRDVIALIGDYLLKNRPVNLAVIFALIQSGEGLTLDVIFRSKEESVNLDRLIKSMHVSGGGRQFKGAFQVKLDFFFSVPDKKKFWSTISEATVKIIKSHYPDKS